MGVTCAQCLGVAGVNVDKYFQLTLEIFDTFQHIEKENEKYSEKKNTSKYEFRKVTKEQEWFRMEKINLDCKTQN